MSRHEIELIYKNLNLECVPCIDIVNSKDIKEITDTDIPISKYAPKTNLKQQAEGWIFKNQDTGIRAKFVREKFKEENSLAFGGTPKYSEDDTGKIVVKYCLNPRIDKCIFKLIDEGNKLEMPLMAKLPQMVYTDVIEEHWQNIMNSRMIIDFRKLKLQVTKRCLMVLRQAITNNEINNKEELKNE